MWQKCHFLVSCIYIYKSTCSTIYHLANKAKEVYKALQHTQAIHKTIACQAIVNLLDDES